MGQALPAGPCHGGSPTGPSEPPAPLCPDNCCFLRSFVPLCILNAITLLSFFALPYFNRKYHSNEQSRQYGSITNGSALLPPSTAAFTCLSCTSIIFTCMSCCWMVAPFPLTRFPLEVPSVSLPMCASEEFSCAYICCSCSGSLFSPWQKSTVLTAALHYIHRTADEKIVMWIFIT